MIRSLKKLADAAWEIRKECPVWADLEGKLPISVKHLNQLIIASIEADCLLNEEVSHDREIKNEGVY